MAMNALFLTICKISKNKISTNKTQVKCHITVASISETVLATLILSLDIAYFRLSLEKTKKNNISDISLISI